MCICENVMKCNKENNRVLTVSFGILQLLPLSHLWLDPQRSEAGISKDVLGSLKSEIKS